MIDKLAQFFLFFDQIPFVICFILFGFICRDKKIFYQATCLMLVNIILKDALKHFFQVPNPPYSLFAYPSGHMQMATALYGWLGLHTNNRALQALTVILLAGVGTSLVYFGYHTWMDVAGAVCFVGITFCCYQILLIQKIKNLGLIQILVSSCALFYIGTHGVITQDVWIFFCALVLFVMARFLSLLLRIDQISV
jgi:membrane-associated phospholipid phosphatase